MATRPQIGAEDLDRLLAEISTRNSAQWLTRTIGEEACDKLIAWCAEWMLHCLGPEEDGIPVRIATGQELLMKSGALALAMFEIGWCVRDQYGRR